MTLIGRYVSSFAEATHALPQDMHMNADYPFMLPKITSWDGDCITIRGRGGRTATLPIKRNLAGEFCELAQSSTFENMFGRAPTTFRMLPFKATEPVA